MILESDYLKLMTLIIEDCLKKNVLTSDMGTNFNFNFLIYVAKSKFGIDNYKT